MKTKAIASMSDGYAYEDNVRRLIEYLKRWLHQGGAAVMENVGRPPNEDEPTAPTRSRPRAERTPGRRVIRCLADIERLGAM